MFRPLASVPLALAVLVPGAARSAAEEPDARTRANRLVEEAKSLYGEEQYAEAAERFEAAWRLEPEPGRLGNASILYAHIKDWRRAHHAGQRFLQEAPDHKDAAEVRAVLTKAETSLAASLVPVRLVTDPPGADLEMDGYSGTLPRTPAVLWVAPGDLRVRATKPGFEPEPLALDVRAAATLERKLVRATLPGRVLVKGLPAGSKLLVDGQHHPMDGPNLELVLPAGSHRIRVEPESGEPFEETLDLAPDARREVPVLFPSSRPMPEAGVADSSRGVPLASWVAFGLAGVSAVAGAVVQLRAMEHRERSETADTQDELDAEYDQAKEFQGFAIGLGAGAVLAAAGGVTWMLLQSGEGTAVRIVPMGTPGGFAGLIQLNF